MVTPPVLNFFNPPVVNVYFSIFHTWLLPTSTCSDFWSYYNWLNAVTTDFKISWNNIFNLRNMFLLSYFSLLSLTLCKKTLKPSKKCFNSKDEKENIYTPEFQLKSISWNMRYNLLQKMFTGKTTLIFTSKLRDPYHFEQYTHAPRK